MALRLADAGMDVAINDVDQASLEEAVAAVSATGRQASGHPADVGDRPRSRRWSKRCWAAMDG